MTRPLTALRFAPLLAAATLALSGCATSYGARTVEPARADYNTAIARSSDQQLLENLVRLRYRDTTSFLQLSGVVTQYEYEGTASASGFVDLDDAQGSTTVGAGVAYLEKPTVSYTPLTGREFAERMLLPIAPETIILFSAQGWSLERLLMCCVEQINGLSNAPAADGPTPTLLPDNSAYKALAARLRRLQNAERVSLEREGAGEDVRYFLVIADTEDADGRLKEDAAAVRRILRLDPDQRRFKLTAFSGHGGGDRVEIRARSVLGTMFMLSHVIDVPDGDRALVTQSQPASGGPQSWAELLGGWFRVHSSDRRPEDAYVSVRHRGSWFYIRDDDLDSKSTFMLVNYLLALQSAAAEGKGPLLTLQTGG